MIKIRLKPSCRISASFVTLLVPIITLVTRAKVHILLLPFGSLPDSNNIHYISSDLYAPILSAEKCCIKHFSAVMIANLVILWKEDEDCLRFLALTPNV